MKDKQTLIAEEPGTEAVNLRHLRAWVTVVDEGSVTAGARRLGVSQPALSQQLRALEEFFGNRLLERLRRGVQPTPLGRALLGDARGALAAADRLTRQARTIAGFDVGVLEVATLPTLVDSMLIDPLRRWQEEYPRVAIQLHEFAHRTTMNESVAKGIGDLAIGVRPPNWSGPVVSLGWEQFLVVLPPSDPLAGGGPVALRELADRNWILYEPSQGLSDYVATACALAGFRPRQAVLTSQVQAAVRLAAAGLGAVLVPSANVPEELAHTARALDPPVAWELTVFARSALSAPAAAFVELVSRGPMPSLPAHAVVLPGD
ncbi:MAG: LysR family transcriptional regulator [bacterium]|nr:LysR family transcriptional regulator [bacterium]